MTDIARPVVDDRDGFIRCESKATIIAESLPHRTVWGMIVDPQRHVWLVQWRRPDKDICPNLWDMSCGGHVDCVDQVPESYAEAYRRELAEELGLTTTLVDVQSLPDALRSGVTHPVSADIGHSIEYHHYPTSWGERVLEREQVRMFLTVYGGPVTLRVGAEPQALAWLTAEQIREELVAPARATLGLGRMLGRCQAVLGQLGS